MSMDFTDQRLSYEKGELDQQSVPDSPFELLKEWMNEAIAQKVQEPYAMSLATCGADNKPSVRIVLMREITENGVIFYTNYESAKGQDIAENPNAEVLFFGMSWSAKYVLVAVLLKSMLISQLLTFKSVPTTVRWCVGQPTSKW